MEGTIDKVVVKIESEVNNTSIANIDKLATSLTNLKQAIKGGFNNLNSLAESLNKLKIASQDLDDLTTKLEDVSKISDALKPLQQIGKPTNFKGLVNALSELPDTMDKFDPSTIENITRVSQDLATALTPVSNKFRDIADGFKSLQAAADKYGISVTKVRDKVKSSTKIFSNFNKVNKAIGKTLTQGFRHIGSGLATVIKSFTKLSKRINMTSLALIGTRSLFTMLRKGVSEYLALDVELANFSQNVWRAFGAQVAPIIEYIMNLFKQAVRVIYSVIKALTGIDLIARANEKALSAMGSSAKDTLGTLQKFDDLNVVEFQDSGSGDDDKLIDLEEIDLTPIQKIMDWVKKLKETISEALDTGKWYNVGVVFADGINMAIEALDFKVLSEKLKNITIQFGEFLNGIIDNLNWSGLGEDIGDMLKLIYDNITTFFNTINWDSLGKGLSDAILGLDLSGVVHSLMTSIGSLFEGIYISFINMDWSSIGEEFSDSIITFLTDIEEIINKIDWELLGNKISDFIINIDWEKIFTTILAIFSGILKSSIDLISGSLDGTPFEKFGEIFENIYKTAEDIGKTIEEWVLTPEFQKTIDLVSNIIDDILGYINEIIKAFDEWWNGEGGKIIKDILVDLTKLLHVLLPPIKAILSAIWDVVSWAWKNIIQPFLNFILRALDLCIVGLTGIIRFLSGDFKGAFEDIKTYFERWKTWMGNIFKSLINFIIELVNSGIRSINNKLALNISGTVAKVLKAVGINVNSGRYQLFTIPEIPKLETGTNEIEYEGLYYLHQGEAVVPEKYNPAVGNNYDSNLSEKMDTLINVMQNMEFTNVVNVGNKTLYKEQQKYNTIQQNKYGIVNV